MNDFSLKKPLVCFFDSGIGGLSLLNFCAHNLDADFLYYADNFNMPYGTKSIDEILRLVDFHFDKIAKLHPTAAVLACNTVTAVAASRLRERYSFPIVGIQPAIKPAAKCGRCVVLATPLTAASQTIAELVKKYGEMRTTVVACPNLAKHIEDNIFDLTYEMVASLLPDIEADALVLGCTHYSFIREIVEKKYSCPVFDGIEGTARHLSSILGKILHQPPKPPKIAFLNGNTTQNRQVYQFINGKKGG